MSRGRGFGALRITTERIGVIQPRAKGNQSEEGTMTGFLSTASRMTFGRTGRRPRRADAPSRLVLHTTETDRLPSYRNGGSAPHFTIGVGHPGSLRHEPPGAVRVWQHVPLDRTARALRHDGPETNHMGAHCIQIEIVTYVGDQRPHGIVGNKGKFPTPLTEALAGLVREILDAVPDIDIDQFPALWSSSNAASASAPQRMSAAEWERFNGICGHQHVPGNTHWDPGAFDIEAFVQLVKGRTTGSGAGGPGDVTDLATWPLLFEDGDRDPQVAVIRGVLQALGYGEFSSSEAYNTKVTEAVLAFQTDERIRIDGIWGPETHAAAEARLDVILRR